MTNPNFDGAISGEFPRKPTDPSFDDFTPEDLNVGENFTVPFDSTPVDFAPVDRVDQALSNSVGLDLSDNNSCEIEGTLAQSSKGLNDRLHRFGRFMLYKQTAWLEWAGGIGMGLGMTEVGVPRTLATMAVMGAVYKAESKLTDMERKKLGPEDQYSLELAKESRVRKVISEILAFSQASWQGATPIMSYNRSAGLENSKTRNRIHAAGYALWCGYYVSPFPYADELRSTTKDILSSTWENARDNPVKAGATITASAMLMFGMYEGIHAFRKRKQVKE